MAEADGLDDQHVVMQLVDDPVVTDPNPVLTAPAHELPYTRRPWVMRQGIDGFPNSDNGFPREFA
ncbi:hypothetical protein HNR23_000507 [Nocardiopsis mwathae]|uniref:Uncharacterized protein n=1 Tax=Nocardiopsis mwathae TaxID=1472723 RepID=A0A7X0D3Q2_9ACTN|nr:hypothetical protein [Nocardiopsis mwathae]